MFRASNMSRAARQATKFNGLSTVASYEILCNVRIRSYEIDEDAAHHDTVVIRAYSPGGQKHVDITAGDIYMMETEYQEAPMARVA